ncbi:MAG: hypothetical protein OXU50_08140 [Gammaproteobacteria bacterium]|nr:hypothetical protein [Gammaproteobacteria bacterium]
MTLRKWIVPVLAAVAVSATALAWWLRDAPWPAMMTDWFAAAPPSAPDDAGAQDEARAAAQAEARAEAQAEALAERRRQAEQAAAELERRLASAEERAAHLRETLTWAGLDERLSAARRLLEIAHAPDKALELLQRTLREIETMPGMEAARDALNDDIARLTEYAAQSPRRAVPLIGELLAMLEPVSGADADTGAGPEPALANGANTGANNGNTDTDSGYWSRFLARLPEQLKAAVRVERRAAPSPDNTRLLRHLLMRARLAALENDAQAFDALTGDAARLAADSDDDAALRDGLAHLRSLEMQWRPPSIGAAFGPPPAEAR